MVKKTPKSSAPQTKSRGQCSLCHQKQEYESSQAWYLHFNQEHAEDYEDERRTNQERKKGVKKFEESLRASEKKIKKEQRKQEDEDEDEEDPLVDQGPFEVLKAADVQHNREELRHRMIANNFMQQLAEVWKGMASHGLPSLESVRFDANREFKAGDFPMLKEIGQARMRRRKVLDELQRNRVGVEVVEKDRAFRDYVSLGQQQGKFGLNLAGEISKHFRTKEAAIIYVKLINLVASQQENRLEHQVTIYGEDQYAKYSFLDSIVREAYLQWSESDFNQVRFLEQ